MTMAEVIIGGNDHGLLFDRKKDYASVFMNGCQCVTFIYFFSIMKHDFKNYFLEGDNAFFMIVCLCVRCSDSFKKLDRWSYFERKFFSFYGLINDFNVVCCN